MLKYITSFIVGIMIMTQSTPPPPSDSDSGMLYFTLIGIIVLFIYGIVERHLSVKIIVLNCRVLLSLYVTDSTAHFTTYRSN